MKSEQVKELARKITDRVARDSISIAIARNDMKWDNEDCTEEEIITDTLNVVLGDDTGCLDEDELTPGNCSVKFVEAALEQAEREAVGQGGARTAKQFKELEHEMGELATKIINTLNYWHGQNWDVKGYMRESLMQVALAAPRPEASTRELRERIEALPRYENGNLGMQTWPNGDWLSREAVLAKFEKEGK